MDKGERRDEMLEKHEGMQGERKGGRWKEGGG